MGKEGSWGRADSLVDGLLCEQCGSGGGDDQEIC